MFVGIRASEAGTIRLRHLGRFRVAALFLILSCNFSAAEEGPAESSLIATAFKARDANQNGVITVEEFVATDENKAAVLRRDFLVFDADGDGQLNPAEFGSSGYWGPEKRRGPIPDAIVELARSWNERLSKRWSEWDVNKDGALDASELAAAKLPAQVSGLEESQFKDWDRDADGKVSLDDMASLLDIAFGVRTSTGELLRLPHGYVLDLRMIRRLNPDAAWTVSRKDYVKEMGSVEAAERWFPAIKSLADDDRFSMTEFATSGHHTDPLWELLLADKNLDGKLSPAEMKGIPNGWAPPGHEWLSGFDDNHDGAYSLREFQLLPHLNVVAYWTSSRDVDEDGKLSRQEFRPVLGIELAGLSAEYFRRLDADADGFLSLTEWPFQTNHPDARFRSLDEDADGQLSESEFLALGTQPPERLHRDFRVFDTDGDGQLTKAEFSAIPYLGPEKSRGPILDPVVDLAKSWNQRLSDEWTKWDGDRDGALNETEFAAVKLPEQVPGLDASKFSDWDRNANGKLSLDELSLVLDMAFGVRVSTGELVRQPHGFVVDLKMLRGLHPDVSWRIARKDYVQAMGSTEAAEHWFPLIKSLADDDRFSITDFGTSGHRTDAVVALLNLDKDLDAKLSPEELKALPAGWGPPSHTWLPGFDDDGDGGYSLAEFHMLPHLNVVISWTASRDVNDDGRLARREFQPLPGIELAALAAEYFRRLDTDSDGFLSLSEWPFQTNHPDARFHLLDADADGELTEAEFTTAGNLPPERLQRDFRLFDWDQNGRMTRMEFLAVPDWVKAELRVTPPDPITVLSEVSFSKLKDQWANWDRNGDQQLDSAEFRKAGLTRSIPGLETTAFSDWDLNRDGSLSQQEAAQLLDVAWGVRAPNGEFLRSASTGDVVDWRDFLAMKPDEHGRLPREAYIRSRPRGVAPRHWFPLLFEANLQSFGVTEFGTSGHRTGPVSAFLAMDQDFNGQLSAAELKSLIWGPADHRWLPGFDDDADGEYSLQEFRLVPQVNLLAGWESATDRNFDGTISPAEFRFMPSPVLAALTAEYFRRLDRDHDGKLSITEWDFSFDPARVPRNVVLAKRDTNSDGRLSLEEMQGDLRQQPPTGRTDPARETALLRIEEAFRRADANQDGQLDLKELSSDIGLEAIAPGALVRSKSTPVSPAATIGNSLGMDEETVRTYIIVEFNILLVVGVSIYMYRKWRRSRG